MKTIDDLFQRLEQLNDIGASLSSEHNIESLLEKILLAAKHITRADGGTLYRLTEDRRHLHFEFVCTDSLGIAFGGTSAQSTSGVFPDLPLYKEDGSPNDSMVAAHAVLNGQTINIADAYEAEGFDFSGTQKFDARTGYRSRSFLTVPMRNHEGEVIGVLQLINAMSQQGEISVFSAADQRLAESLASQAAVYLSARKHQKAPGGADGVMHEMRYSLLGSIREQARRYLRQEGSRHHAPCPTSAVAISGTAPASSGQMRRQSSGRMSRRVTAPAV